MIFRVDYGWDDQHIGRFAANNGGCSHAARQKWRARPALRKTDPCHPEHVAHRANPIISFFVMIVYDLFLRSPVMGYRKGRLI